VVEENHKTVRMRPSHDWYASSSVQNDKSIMV
jgi:hypothetical protein